MCLNFAFIEIKMSCFHCHCAFKKPSLSVKSCYTVTFPPTFWHHIWGMTSSSKFLLQSFNFIVCTYGGLANLNILTLLLSNFFFYIHFFSWHKVCEKHSLLILWCGARHFLHWSCNFVFFFNFVTFNPKTYDVPGFHCTLYKTCFKREIPWVIDNYFIICNMWRPTKTVLLQEFTYLFYLFLSNLVIY